MNQGSREAASESTIALDILFYKAVTMSYTLSLTFERKICVLSSFSSIILKLSIIINLGLKATTRYGVTSKTKQK